MTVERQEFRKQKTMRIVRRPPMTSVFRTSSTDSRIMTDASRTRSISVPGGSSGRSFVDLPLHGVDDADRVGLRLLQDLEGDRGNAVHEGEGARLLDAVHDRRDLAQRDGMPAAAADHHRLESGHEDRLSGDPDRDLAPAGGSGGREGCSRSRPRARRSLRRRPSPSPRSAPGRRGRSPRASRPRPAGPSRRPRRSRAGASPSGRRASSGRGARASRNGRPGRRPASRRCPSSG